MMLSTYRKVTTRQRKKAYGVCGKGKHVILELIGNPACFYLSDMVGIMCFCKFDYIKTM